MAESNPQLRQTNDPLENVSTAATGHAKPNPPRKYPSSDLFQPVDASPVPIINEFSDQSHQSRVKPRKAAANGCNKRLRRDSSANIGLDFDTRLETGGLLSENAAAFALHQSANNMHMANLTLKTRVNRLMCDNQQLNQRVDQISQKNHALALERERLLTTLQNTSAILQSTVGTLSQEHDPNPEPDPLCFQLEGANAKSVNLESDSDSDSDSLERSTKCTIKEFDNLLSALQGRESRQKQASAKVATNKITNQDNPSQYDVIVKWLNNKTVQPSKMTPTYSDSSTTESIRDDEDTGSAIPQHQQTDANVNETRTSVSSVSKSFEEPGKQESPIKLEDIQIVLHTGSNLQSCGAEPLDVVQVCTPPREELGSLAIEEMPPSKTLTPPKDEVDDRDNTVENVVFGDSAVWLGMNDSVRPPVEEKTEFLQSWLEDLKTRTQRFKESRRNSVATTQLANGKPSDDEHEEFISLCNTMIDRMDSMISKTTRCHATQRSSQSGKIMNFLMNEGKDLNLKHSSRRKKKASKRLRKKPHHNQHQRRFNDAGSTASSDVSWTELAEVEKDKTGLKTFQKCLANLEEMNMRRTNNALTQTLIIKALRKLMARQCCRMAKDTEQTEAEESDDNISSSSSSERNADNDGDDERVHTDNETQQASLVNRQTDQEISDTDHNPEARGQMYDVINNVSKSIIYQDLGDDFTRSVGEQSACFHQPHLTSPPELLTRLNAAQRKQKQTFDPSTSKIYHELKRLEMEQKKPIPAGWFYLALILTLTQTGFLRLLKYFGRFLLKL